jgi:MerR family transcriptional regulator, light-induced transcriptional regulator
VTTETPRAQPLSTNSSGGGLTIGELAGRTGISTATLRMWETRHGFPRARRLPSGHRRYDEATADRVLQVQRLRDSGVRLETAIAQVTAGPEAAIPSVYAELRQRYPDLVPHRLRKSTLLALTWALEDECCARAQSPWLFGAFQQERFYRRAEARWRELARTARRAWVLADFPGARPHVERRPTEVALPETSAMRREWSLVCAGEGFAAALAAWELPGQDDVADGDRVFESIWTLEPVAVADAARCCARVVRDVGHDTTGVLEDLDRPLPPASGDLKDATALFNRVVGYVDRVR